MEYKTSVLNICTVAVDLTARLRRSGIRGPDILQQVFMLEVLEDGQLPHQVRLQVGLSSRLLLHRNLDNSTQDTAETSCFSQIISLASLTMSTHILDTLRGPLQAYYIPRRDRWPLSTQRLHVHEHRRKRASVPALRSTPRETTYTLLLYLPLNTIML